MGFDMGTKKPSDGAAAPHVPGQGFSEESEKFFAEFVSRKREAVDIQPAQEAPRKAAHELDDVTRELRYEFALLKKIFELREIAKQRSNKQSRRAAKAAIREAKKAGKKPKEFKTPKRTKPSNLDQPDSKWIVKICWRCKSKFSIHADWERPPSLCKTCTKDLDETHLPSAPDRSTPFTRVHFVRGGAPSLGKRR
jgi:hypothetical protein